MKLLDPVRIVDISLSARNVLHAPRIHEQYFEATRFEDLKNWDPVNTGRFHRYRGDTDVVQLIGALV